MASIDSLSCQQEKNGMEALRCMHSVVCQKLAEDWENLWDLPDIDIDIESFKLICSPHVQVKKLRHDDLFLCATQSGGLISLLYTVTKRQKTPMCSRCASTKCKCYRMYERHKIDRQTNNDDMADDDDWPSSDEEVEGQRVQHYQDENIQQYGHNSETIMYPIQDDPTVHTLWIQRVRGIYSFPDKIIPVFDPDLKCKEHQNGYNPDDSKLIEQSANMVVYLENSDVLHETKTFSRPTIGRCKCRQQPSGHSQLLWHIGSGKMVDYLMLHKFIHDWRSGFSMYSLFQ